MQIPLSDREEAILQLLKQVRQLEEENIILRQELKELYWRLQEHD
jgi:hypothetical protein